MCQSDRSRSAEGTPIVLSCEGQLSYLYLSTPPTELTWNARAPAPMFGVPNDSTTSISAPLFHFTPAVQSENQNAETGFGMRTRDSHNRSRFRREPPRGS